MHVQHIQGVRNAIDLALWHDYNFFLYSKTPLFILQETHETMLDACVYGS